MKTLHLRKPGLAAGLKQRRYRTFFPEKYYERKRLRDDQYDRESIVCALIVFGVLVFLSLVVIPKALDLILSGLW